MYYFTAEGDLACGQVFPISCQEVDNTCASNTVSNMCSSVCPISMLTDCDLGKSDGLPTDDITKHFYILSTESNYTWLDFTFRDSEMFVLESIKMYYYCTMAGLTEFSTIEYEYNTNRFAPVNGIDQPMECNLTEDRKELNFKVDNKQYSIKNGARIRIKIFLCSYCILYLSEVQFFMKFDECAGTVSPTPSRCCSTTVKPEILYTASQSCSRVAVAPTSTPASGGEQGAVVAVAVTSTLAGVLVIIIIALVVTCFAVIIYRRRHHRVDTEIKGSTALANPVYNARELGHAVKTDDNFTNPAYSTSALGRVAGVNEEFVIPAYSSVAISSAGPECPQDPLRPDKALPQYAMLESPSALTTLTTNQHYEEVDDKVHHSSHSSQANAIATNLSPTAAAKHRYEFSDDNLKEGNKQHTHSTDHLPVRSDPSTVDNTYSHLVHDPPGKKNPPDPSYSHLIHDSRAGGRSGEPEAASDPSSYSQLLHKPQGDGDQVAGVATKAQDGYSRLVLGGKERDAYQK